MARAVTIYFKNNNDAEEFIKHVRFHGGLSDEPFVDEPEDTMPATILGLYALPTNYCTCEGDLGSDVRHKLNVRGGKLGWWVHKTCGRMRPQSFQPHPKNLLLEGIQKSYPVGFSFWANDQCFQDPKEYVDAVRSRSATSGSSTDPSP